MTKYCVTGGCGFIGSHLVDALIAAGHSVVVLDNLSTGKQENLHPEADLLIGDITNPHDVMEVMQDVSGCFHLAAIASVQKSNQEWALTHKSNLTGTINIFEAAATAQKSRKVPVVFASSAAIYGDNACVPLVENEMPSPMTAYGADKLGCELNGRVAYLVHDIPNYGFRFFNVYGPRQDPKSPYSGVISIFCERALSNQTLNIYGDGGQSRDFVYVGDVVRFLMHGMRAISHRHDIFNICTGHQTSIKDLAYIIRNLCESDSSIEFREPRKGDIRLSLGCPQKLKKAFGMDATTRIGDGLEIVLSSLQENSILRQNNRDEVYHVTR